MCCIYYILYHTCWLSTALDQMLPVFFRFFICALVDTYLFSQSLSSITLSCFFYKQKAFQCRYVFIMLLNSLVLCKSCSLSQLFYPVLIFHLFDTIITTPATSGHRFYSLRFNRLFISLSHWQLTNIIL